MSETNAIATTHQNTKLAAVPKSVKSWINSDYFKTQVALVLPKHLTADRFVRVAMSAVGRVPKLADCTPESVMAAMMTCSELGIEPDGRRAHLIPYGKDCKLIIDYKGLVELAKRSGDVSNIHAQIVCANDAFEYNTGEITHKIDFRNERGAMYAAYVIIHFKDGGKHAEVMTKADIDRIRTRSKAGNNGPWVSDYDEMAKKTVFRRASKWITLSPEIRDALDKDADAPAPLANTLVTEMPLSLSEGEPSGTIEAQAEVVQEKDPERKSTTEVRQSEPLHTVQQTLAEVVTGAGHNFTEFRKIASELGHLPDPDSVPDFDAVPGPIAKRLLNAKTGLLMELAKGRGK